MIHIIKVKPIRDFIVAHPQYAAAIEAWLSIVRHCTWEKPSDIVGEFGPKAIDILRKKDNKPTTKSSERVVFDIMGNNIRIIAKYQFHPKLKEARLYIKWIGTHTEYDKLCARGKQFDIELFK
jgi:mRNA interferase HigB